MRSSPPEHDRMELTMSQRKAVTKKKALAYRAADRAGKSRILASWSS